MSRVTRKHGLVAFGAIGTALAVSSVALACVTFKGDLTVSGSQAAGNRVSGTGNSHAYCPGFGPVTAAAGPQGSTVNVTVAPATGCASATNFLPTATYEVRLHNTNTGFFGANGFGWTMRPSSGCFLGTNSTQTATLGTMSVVNGHGSATLPLNPTGSVPALTPNGVGDASDICVGSPALGGGGGPGMIAPFQVTVI